jgi:hypothetical protein
MPGQASLRSLPKVGCERGHDNREIGQKNQSNISDIAFTAAGAGVIFPYTVAEMS